MIQDSSRIGVLVSMMFLAWVNVNTALAQSHPAANVQDALKNIKPSGGSCTQNNARKPKPPKVVRVAEVKPDLSCAMAPMDLVHHFKFSNTVLVDTRSATDFVNYHIDGAMNMSTTEVRSKSFLRAKSVVLIGNGKAERELYTDCKRLKSNGFKQVKVLRGGMPAWLASGQSDIGTPSPVRHS